MKPHLLSLCAALLFAVASSAQAALDYAFSEETQGAYSPLTNSAALFVADFDDVISPAITITPFSMGGVTYNTMYVNSNGYITLGQGSMFNNYTPLSTSYGAATISPFGDDLQSIDNSSSISYTIDNMGTHVEWTNVRRYNVDGEVFSFQAHLLPFDSTIKFVYGPLNNISSTVTFAQVGIRVGMGDSPEMYSSRSVMLDESWFPSQAGTSSSSTCIFMPGTTPFSGLTYIWQSQPTGIYGCTDPAACNFNSAAQYNNFSCEYCSCQTCGCMDSSACNFDLNATYPLACSYECYGCTDATATNFDPNATYSDGSCFYAGPGEEFLDVRCCLMEASLFSFSAEKCMQETQQELTTIMRFQE